MVRLVSFHRGRAVVTRTGMGNRYRRRALSRLSTRRRRVTRSRRRTRRGMQRIKTTRWPTRNPFGDRMFYTFKATFGVALTDVTFVNGSAVVETQQMNSMPALAAQFIAAPGLLALGQNFNRYRIRGIKIRATAWPMNADYGLAASPPSYLFFNAAALQSQFPASMGVNIAPEQRWCRYALIRAPHQGAKPTSLSVYYSVNKVYGPDQVVRNDQDFTGLTANTLAAWTAPTAGPSYQIGFFTMGGESPANQEFNIQVTYKIYMQMFEKIPLAA